MAKQAIIINKNLLILRPQLSTRMKRTINRIRLAYLRRQFTRDLQEWLIITTTRWNLIKHSQIINQTKTI